MFTLLSRIFIKEAQVDTPQVREKYGILCSVISILANLLCVGFKLVFGNIVHSSAIMADGYNNLSDAVSNIASLLGFKLSGKHPDAKHPYGHGRFEYLTGLFIAALILLFGASSLWESFLKVVSPVRVNFSISAFIAIVFSIFIKIWMYRYNYKTGELIDSETLKAAGQDSLNDVITSVGSLVALISAPFTTLPVDGMIGIILSMVVIKSGLEIANTMLDALLGKKPDPAFVQAIVEKMLSYRGIYGVHDIMIHDYGPGRRYLIAHLEVSSDENIMEAHNLIDHIEDDITNMFQIFTTIHMDPIELHDPLTNELREKVTHIVTDMNPLYSIHDFRIVKGDHTKLIFDVLIKGDHIELSTLEKKIVSKIKEIDTSYECVIQFDFAYV